MARALFFLSRGLERQGYTMWRLLLLLFLIIILSPDICHLKLTPICLAMVGIYNGTGKKVIYERSSDLQPSQHPHDHLIEIWAPGNHRELTPAAVSRDQVPFLDSLGEAGFT